MTYTSAAFAASLLAGHALGDFVFQTRWMIERKNRASGLLVHGVTVGLCHTAFMIPFLDASVAILIVGITVAHVLIDAVKTRLAARMPARSLELFVSDQAMHVATLAAAQWLLPAPALHESLPWFAPRIAAAAGLVAAFAFNVNGMSAIVEGVLQRLGMRSDRGPRVGRAIGILERLFALVLLQQDLAHGTDAVGRPPVELCLGHRSREVDELLLDAGEIGQQVSADIG
jgi:hypothetical protein